MKVFTLHGNINGSIGTCGISVSNYLAAILGCEKKKLDHHGQLKADELLTRLDI